MLSKKIAGLFSFQRTGWHPPLGGGSNQQCVVGNIVAGHPLLDDPSTRNMVENTGLEPVTSGLQSRRSPN